MYLGLPKKRTLISADVTPDEHISSSFSWQRETLQISPVVCCGHDNVIFISDGVTSKLSVFEFAPGNKIDHKSYSLPYCGVIEIRNATGTSLDLLTCDGRTYKCSWKVLVESVKSEKSVKLSENNNAFTVEEVMTGIQRCSEMVQVEGKHIHHLNVYLNQLSLALTFLAEPQKDIFSATLKIEQQFEKRDMYVALLSLRKISNGVNFEGKWWKLNATVLGKDCKQTVCVKLDGYNLNKDINLSVPLPNVDILHSLSPIKMTCHLVLGHYTTLQPVCYILACPITIDIFHFLTPCHKHSLRDSVTSSGDFSAAMQTLALKKQQSEISPRTGCSPVPSCHVRISFMNNDINQKLLLSLLNINSLAKPSDISTVQDSDHLQFWYHDIPVDVSYMQLKGRLVVSVSGPIPSLVLSVKAAIERQITDRGSVPPRVTLTSEVFEQAQQSCQVLEFQYSKATTQVALSHLHDMITKMLCNVPL